MNNIEPREKKRISAVLDLYISELDFLYNRLLVLRNVFMEPLKACQVEGILITVEPELLFGNLEELCQESFDFCTEFTNRLLSSHSAGSFCSSEIIADLLVKFTHSVKTISNYQAYCINYKAILEYLESIRKNEDRFAEFERICNSDRRCNRLRLQDFLVAPLHRITRLPIHLKEIRKYTQDENACTRITDVLSMMDEALTSIDDSIQWLHNFETLQELQSQIIWPPVAEIDTRAFIPEFMRGALSRQFCEKLLAHPRRKLIHDGYLVLLENQRQMDMYAFLFNDMFLLAKVKKASLRPKKYSSANHSTNDGHRHPGNRYIVHKQPVPLDCCVLCVIPDEDAKNCHVKHGFVVLQLTRFCQATAVYTLQAPTREAKVCWLNKFQESIENYESIQLKDLMKCTSDIMQSPYVKSRSNSGDASPRGSISHTSPDHTLGCDIFITPNVLH